MKFSDNTLEKLARTLVGDEGNMPYRTGPKIVAIFNRHGFNDTYPSQGGFPSRWAFALDKLRALNGTDGIRTLVDDLFDARNFLEFEGGAHKAVEHLNRYLKFDRSELAPEGDNFRLRQVGAVSVEFTAPASQTVDHSFIEEQVRKCDKKISEGDLDGAITNARTLIEAVLITLEKKLSATPEEYDGDLLKLYKRVQSLLELHPSRKDISDTIRQVLTGLTSIVNGLAGMRNKLSDAHAAYRPAQHHAKLAVNSAKTLADFLFDTYAYQKARNQT